MSIRCLTAPCLALALGAILLLRGGALACSVDGVASLSVDGRLASPSSGPAGYNLATWAPFTLDAAAPGTLLHFAEDLPKVRRTLPAEAFRLPFRWSFGDGLTVMGRAATHRYVRAVRYTVTVSYYWPARHRWVEFDRAAEPILPAGALWPQPARQAPIGLRLVPLGLLAALAVAGGLLSRTWTRFRRRWGHLPPRPAPAGALPRRPPRR